MKYVVCKEAVYLHDVYGAYDTARDAVTQAEELAHEDVDAHHRWVVRSLDTVHGLGEEEIHAVRKPYCAYCGAPPPPAFYGGSAKPCPCRVTANPEGSDGR